jgi:sigma-B regulation protein RsbU (phosphoserine phosphatase)
MVDLTALTNTLALLSTAALIIIIALICLRTKTFNPSAKSGTSKISIGILLGLLAVFATLMGTKLPDGTIINVRELAVMIAGIAGGPISGVIAGIIGGLHRYTVGGATALPCTISTVAIGLISGLVWMKISGKNSLIKAGLLGLSLESMAMGLFWCWFNR